jgi:TPR repeat protein
MMSKVKVLFFAADPLLGRPGGEPLELAEDLRQIKRRVRQARYGHRLVFESHGAARADDLIDLLENTDARVVHFSGHGGNRGLVFVRRGGQHPHAVDAAALQRLFRAGHGSVRLAVLSACSSEPEARAIADVVGCAIGTLTPIGDDAAITFNSRFYEAIANGYSVHRAHEKACTALQVHRIPEHEYPRVFVRDSIGDQADLVLVKTHRLVPRRVVAATAACLLTAVAIVTDVFGNDVPPEPTVSDIACGAAPPASGMLDGALPVASSTSPEDPDGVAEELATAKKLYRARNYDSAIPAFERAAEGGNGEAMTCLGIVHMYGRGVKPQPEVGFEWVHRAAIEERDANGMYALAVAYQNGIGVERREHLAEDWFEKAAAKGHAEAMRSLGSMYLQEKNDSSYHLALQYFHQAVNAGSVDARVDVGMVYELGLGVARNLEEAFRQYRSAAHAGSPRGMFAMGQSYQKGVGVPQDYKKALAAYRKAAGAGSADAMNSIGTLYHHGLGVQRSLGKAIRWYERAAQAGSPLAKGNLGALGRD